MGIITRLVRKLFTAEIMGLALVLLALQLFIYGVTSSLRNTDTKYFLLACLIALLIGLGLSRRNSKPLQASARIVALGVAGIWILGARLVYPLINLIRSVIIVLPQLIPAIRFKTPIDASAITEAWLVIVQASVALALRFQTWMIGLDKNVRVNDALLRNMIWLLLLWLVAAWMGWFTARRNAILALLLPVLLLAFVTSYSEYKPGTILGLVFVMLLLMGVWNYRNHTHQWETRKVDYSDSIRYDNTQAVLVLAMIISSMAVVTPSISWREIRDYLRTRNQENQLADALGVQEQLVNKIKVPTQKPSLPRDHLLSGGFANSEEIVMTIRTGELPPIANPSLTADAPRYYWRSVVYDQYVGSGWVTTSAPPQKYNANTPLIPGLLKDYKPIHLDVQLVEPEGKLFWSGTLFSADIPITVDWRIRPTSNLFADQSSLIRADMFAAATSATAYSAEAYLPNVTIDELRAAPADYSDEIHARYLQLPRDLPERVSKLANQITAGKFNSYDKAKAIETYLRTNYPYDLEVPAPPEDQDVADYFLFDLKKGYCDYYATAMVVLARASGIPARFVSGYSPGTYDAPNAQYIIRELNAHSWVEVYFADIGWIEFEPTGSIPEIVRQEKQEELTPTPENDTAASNLLTRFRLERLSFLILPIFVFLGVLVLYFSFIEKWLYMRLAPANAIEKIYKKFYRAGRSLAGEWTHAETSSEFTKKLINTLNDKQTVTRIKKLYADSPNEINTLTSIYHSVLFRDIHTQRKEFLLAWRAWTKIRWRLWVARITSIKLNKLLNLKLFRRATSSASQ